MSALARPGLSLLLAALLSACATGVQQQAPAPVQSALQAAGLPPSALAVVAFPLDAPEQGLRLQPDRLMQPGSTMKLVTAAVALDQLGPNSRGKTELLAELPASGVPADGRLSGPLYLRGGADNELDWGTLWLMLRELRERQGVRQLAGGIVVDRSLFQPARPELGAPPFDEQPEFPYNVIPDALHLGGGLLRFELQSDERGLQLRPFPDFGGLQVDSSGLVLNDLPCKDWEQRWQPPQADGAVLRLHGEFPRQCRVSQAFSSVDRQWLTAQALRQLWTQLGGELAGEIREGSTPAAARLLVRHQDRPLAEQLRQIMKSSDNAATRLIYLRLGAAQAQPGEDTRVAAERVVRAWFARQGIAPDGLVMDNGSGLSRTERLSAAQLAALLRAAQQGAHGPELLATLPVAGVDGTLSRRLKGTAAEGRARLKTGTLRDVTGLAGYVPDSRGRLWVVAAFVNDAQASKGRASLDALMDWIARQ